MLKLYTDIKLINEGNRPYVFPLIFDLYFSKSKFLMQYYSLTDSIKNSDIIILPLEYTYMLKKHDKYLTKFLTNANEFEKPIWVYSGGDFGISLEDQKIYNFRLGGFKNKLNDRTIILPSFVTDPYLHHLKQNLKFLEKEKVPGIGFVGHAKGGFIKYFKELLIFFHLNFKRILNFEYADYQPFFPSSIKRAKYLKYLQSSSEVVTNFIFRDKYRAGVKVEKDKAVTTNEFFNNIYENPYTFCMRGGGNFSVRFYEVLAVGRIPVLLNTNCLLPLDNFIDWAEHCVILDESEFKSIGNYIKKFHNDLSADSFLKLQEGNRKLWEDFLTRHSFFKVIHDQFIAKLN
jgi:hypothetical protein